MVFRSSGAGWITEIYGEEIRGPAGFERSVRCAEAARAVHRGAVEQTISGIGNPAVREGARILTRSRCTLPHGRVSAQHRALQLLQPQVIFKLARIFQ